MAEVGPKATAPVITLRPCDLDLVNDLDLHNGPDLDFSRCPKSTFSPQLALKVVAVTWWQSLWPICHCPCNDLKTL